MMRQTKRKEQTFFCPFFSEKRTSKLLPMLLRACPISRAANE
jgi:hypothetical protein